MNTRIIIPIKKYLFLLCWLWFLVSCKKESIVPTTPQEQIKGTWLLTSDRFEFYTDTTSTTKLYQVINQNVGLKLEFNGTIFSYIESNGNINNYKYALVKDKNRFFLYNKDDGMRSYEVTLLNKTNLILKQHVISMFNYTENDTVKWGKVRLQYLEFIRR